MNKIYLMILLSLLTGLVACSSNVKPHTRPDWVSGNDRHFPSAMYLTGRGSASRLDEASDRARADLAKIFEVEISEASSDVQKFNQGADSKGRTSSTSRLQVSRDIQVRTGRILHGVEIADSWHDPDSGLFYALAVLKRQPAAQELRNEIGRHDQATRLYIVRAQQDNDLLGRIAAASRAVDQQDKRAYLQRTLNIIQPGSAPSPPWSVDRLRLDRDTLIQKLVLVPKVSGEHADDIGPLLKAAVASAGFTVEARSGQPHYVLDGMAGLDGPIVKDGWYWLRGTLEIRLQNPDGTERGVRRWPLKASAQNSDDCYRRVLDQIDSVFKQELRNTIISFAADT